MHYLHRSLSVLLLAAACSSKAPPPSAAASPVQAPAQQPASGQAPATADKAKPEGTLPPSPDTAPVTGLSADPKQKLGKDELAPNPCPYVSKEEISQLVDFPVKEGAYQSFGMGGTTHCLWAAADGSRPTVKVQFFNTVNDYNETKTYLGDQARMIKGVPDEAFVNAEIVIVKRKAMTFFTEVTRGKKAAEVSNEVREAIKGTGASAVNVDAAYRLAKMVASRL